MEEKNFLQKAWDKIKSWFKDFAPKFISYVKQAKIELIVLFSVLFIDLLIKGIVGSTMQEGQTKEVIPNFFNLHYTVNRLAAFGSAFGLEKLLGLEGVRILFLIVTTIAVIVFFIFMVKFRGQHMFSRLAFAFIIAGALGNYFDRMFLKGVRDMFEIVYFGKEFFGSTSFAIFNFADASLIAGIIIFAIYFIFMYKDPKKRVVGPVYQENFDIEEYLKENPEHAKEYGFIVVESNKNTKDNNGDDV